MHPRSFARRLAAGAAGGTGAALLVVASAAAQEGGNGGLGSGVASFGLGDWFGLMSRLALVVLVIWAGVYAMRWWVRRVNGGGFHGRHRQLEVVETHALGPNRALHLVRLGGRAVLIGATPERINSILEIDDPEEVERLAEPPAEPERVALRSPLTSIMSAAPGTSLLGRLASAPARLATARAAQAVPAAEGAEVTAAASVAAPPAREPHRPFSFSDLITEPTTVDEALAMVEADETGGPEPDDEPPPAGRARRRAARRGTGLFEGLRRLPQAFRMPPARAAQRASREQRDVEAPGAAPAMASSTARGAREQAGLFERTVAASHGGSRLGRYAEADGSQSGGFSAALAAMEARDRGAADEPGPRPTPSPLPSQREAVAERAGLGELARDPQAFQRMSREQQIAQVQRAIQSVRDSMERSA